LLAISSSERRWGAGQTRRHLARPVAALAALGILGLLLASCQTSSDAPVVVKIGLIAPFEGVGRRLGYAVLPVIERELAAATLAGSDSSYRVALVALNDDLDPSEAAAQARALVQDPDVQAVIGLWSEESVRLAAPILADAGVPVLLTTPYSVSGQGVTSLCPTPDRLAAELLRLAQEAGDRRVVLAGPDTMLRRALSARNPELPVIPEVAHLPCEGSSASDCWVLYSGDAVGAAEALRRWRASGWQGVFLGGPETARPWLIEQAEGAAQAARAVVCGNHSATSTDQDASLQFAADLAGAAARTILTELDQAVAEQGRASRPAIAEKLSSWENNPDVVVLEVRDGRWSSRRE
jgi:hypothetical protein